MDKLGTKPLKNLRISYRNRPEAEKFVSDLRKWDPLNQSPPPPPRRSELSPLQFLSVARRLSPVARFILDAFRKNNGRWGPEVVSELEKLRRVTPNLVTEVLKVETNPTLATRFFHWAGRQKGYNHNFSCYNAFAYCLNRGNLFRAADHLPELMDAQGKQPSEKQFEILIRMHADSNRGLRVYYVYEKMRKFEIRPRVFLYNRVMEALVKTNYLDLALSVYQDFKSDGLKEENVTFMVLVKGLCRAGRMAEAIELIRKMRENACTPDVFAYTAMLKILGREVNLDGCLRIWKEMKNDGVEPDMMAYKTFISALCNGGMMEVGCEILKGMKARGLLIDRSIYEMLIEVFVRKKKVQPAIDLFEDLVNSGYITDLKLYNLVIEGLCHAQQVDNAHKLFKSVVNEGLQPDFDTVFPMLMQYAEMNKMEDLYLLLLQMEKLGFSVKNDAAVFFKAILMEDGDSKAWNVFNLLKEKGFSSVQIYNALMENLLQQKETKKILSLLKEMTDLGMNPDAVSLSIALVCHVEEGRIQDARKIYSKITEMSCIPSVEAYCFLARGLAERGEIDAAMIVVRECLSSVQSGPLEFKYCLTVRHVCKERNAEKVMEVVKDMKDEGCLPGGVFCAAVISGMCRSGSVDEARKVLVSMVEMKLLSEAQMIVYEDILIDYSKKMKS